MTRFNNSRDKKKKLVVITVVVLVLVALLLVVLEKTRVTNLYGLDGLIIDTRKDHLQEGVNYEEATEQEREETEAHKDSLTDDNKDEMKTNEQGLKVVTPVIAYADNQVINASVSGIFEEGGKCTATLTNGSASVTRESTGFENASYTQCAPIDISGVGVGAGWSAKVKYESSTSAGESEVYRF